jgi:hypothetical protein
MRGLPMNRPQSPSQQNQLTPEELADWDYWCTAPQNN